MPSLASWKLELGVAPGCAGVSVYAVLPLSERSSMPIGNAKRELSFPIFSPYVTQNSRFHHVGLTHGFRLSPLGSVGLTLDA